MTVTPIEFSLAGVNQLGLPGPGQASFSWDELGFDFDKTWRISDDSLGIDIPRVDAGFDLIARAEARFFVEMGFDVGTAGIEYSLSNPVITGNHGVRTLAGEDLPFFLFGDPKLDTGTIAFADGDIVPVAGDLSGNYVNVGVETELYIATKNAGIFVDLPWPVPNIDIDFPDIELFNSPKAKRYLIQFDADSDPVTGNPDGIIDGSLYLPRLVGQSGEADPWDEVVVEGGGATPSLSVEGDAVAPGPNGTFFNLQVDIDRALSSILGLPNLNDTKSLSGGFSLSYNLIDADFDIGLQVSQELTFVVDGVGVSVDSYATPHFGDSPLVPEFHSEHFEGLLGDEFVFDTPSGEGLLKLVTTYTLYGHYVSEAGVKVVGALHFSALGFSVHNTIGPDFDVGFGPLVDLTIPDPPFETDRLNLFTQSLPVTFDAVTKTYSVWYEQPPAPGTDGDDPIFYGPNFDDPDLDPPRLDEEGDPAPVPETRHGYRGNDTMLANDHRNVMFGDEGDDSMDGRGGRDDLWGGSGADFIYGGGGNDLVFAGPGGDTVWGGADDDNVLGLGGDDRVYGEDGNDTLSSGMGTDCLSGGAGNDSIYLDNLDGDDILEGDDGVDRVIIDARTTTIGIDLNSAIQFTEFPFHAQLKSEFLLPGGAILREFEAITVRGGFGADTLLGADEDDRLGGGGGGDIIGWSQGHDSLWGEGGDDTIAYLMGSGPDDLDGGAGADLLLLQATGSGQIVIDLTDLAGGEMTLPDGAAVAGFEQLWLAGDAAALPLTAEATVNGGALADTLTGGLSNDSLTGAGGRNILDGAGGDDTLVSSTGGDTVKGGAGTDFLVLERTGTRLGLSLDLSQGEKPGLDASLVDTTKIDSIEQIDFRGGVVSDQVTGGLLADTLVGAGGSDVLAGHDGSDSIDGGAGGDLIELKYGGGADTVDGGDGADGLRADFGQVSHNVSLNLTFLSGQISDGTSTNHFANFEKYDIRTGSGDDSIRGGDSDPLPLIRTIGEFPNVQIFVQRTTGDVLRTGAGKDSVDGGLGADLIDAGTGDDVVWLSPGADILNGGDDQTAADQPKIDRDTLVIDLSRFSGAELEALKTFVMPETPVDAESEVFHIDATGADITDFERLDYRSLDGAVSIVGGAYEDSLNGSSQGDSIGGGGGTDHLKGGQGADTLVGGSGDDTVDPGPAGEADKLDGGLGYDVLSIDRRASSTPSNIDFRPSFGVQTDGAATMTGFEQLKFQGGLGSDTVRVDYGPHQLHGGFSAGFDRVFVDLRNVDHDVTAQWVGSSLVFDNGLTLTRFIQWNVIVGDHGFTVTGGGVGFPTVNVTNAAGQTIVMGTSGPDVIYGQFAAEDIRAGDGDDQANGGFGDDAISGGNDNDSLSGDFGDDSVSGDSGADSLSGGEGDDELEGGSGADTLQGGPGDDEGDGGPGPDSLGGQPGADTLVGGADADTLSGDEDGDSLAGGGGADSLIGDADGDTLAGGPGADTLVGAEGDDSLQDDGEGGDSMLGRGGEDSVEVDRSASTADLAVKAGGGSVSVSDGTTAKQVESTSVKTGSGADDATLVGPAGAHSFDGGGGANTATVDMSKATTPVTTTATGAGASQTTTTGGSITVANVQAVRINGGSANDTLASGSAHGQATLSGNGGADSLASGVGADSLKGGAGDDTLSGGGGNDRLLGGEGADVFILDKGSGDDRVKGFSLDEGDRVGLATGSDYTVNQHGGKVVVEMQGGASLTLGNLTAPSNDDWFWFY